MVSQLGTQGPQGCEFQSGGQWPVKAARQDVFCLAYKTLSLFDLLGPLTCWKRPTPSREGHLLSLVCLFQCHLSQEHPHRRTRNELRSKSVYPMTQSRRRIDLTITGGFRFSWYSLLWGVSPGFVLLRSLYMN